jgi:hypothetical protein
MDVLERRPERDYSAELKKLIRMLQYPKSKVELKGSASLTSQKYPSDYDLFTTVPKDKDKLYDFLTELLTTIEGADDLWFVELKLQTLAGRKIRVFPGGHLKREVWDRVFDKLDYVKLDLIARISGFFSEVSILYAVSDQAQTPEEYIASLQKDIKDLAKEKKWYKILKRTFNILKAEGDKKGVLRLSRIFNSELGERYQTISRLEAIEKVLDVDQDPQTIQKAKNSLKDLRVPADVANLSQWVKDRSAELNAEAKKLQ